MRLSVVMKILSQRTSLTKPDEKKVSAPPKGAHVSYVKLVFGNELRIEKKNLDYHELKELVEKLEGLC